MTTQTPYILGLTGSIGMGKSTTSRFFAEYGVPVWDADAAVHYLYQGDTPAVTGIAALVPDAVSEMKVDRDILREAINQEPGLLKQVEEIVHPLVSLGRQMFVENAEKAGHKMMVIDHPLLFETGIVELCDGVLVVSASPEEQRRRVLSRPSMTEESFEFILSRQMPDSEKRANADFVLETTTPEAVKIFVRNLIDTLTQEDSHA